MELDADVWTDWCAAAHAANRHRPPDEPNVGRKWQASGPPADDSPGTDFNRRGSWEETGLFDLGWRWERRQSETAGLVRRPGKDKGASASIGVVSSAKNSWPLFWCWSTSVPEFKTEVPYSRFAVFAILTHKGDFSAAAKDLKARGYGRPMPQVGAAFCPAPAATGEDRIFKWMSELRRQADGTKWLWHGFVSRGGVTLFSALWKIGKTTMLGHLIRAFDGRNEKFLDQPITPSKVLYVTEEHEELWAERRDDLGIGDHIGIVCRPFRGRPSPAEWVEFIAKLVAAVTDHQFDLVVLDSISKLWPVREENDAGQVEEALMPLWAITNLGAALFLVHHTRKAGGGEFTGSRGSGGLPAFCETLIEFRRAEDNTKDPKRLMSAKGRYKETPDKLLVELTPAGYVSRGDPDNPTVKAIFGAGLWKQKALDILPKEEPGLTLEELQQKLGDDSARKADVLAWLHQRTEDGELTQTGKGAKGTPYRWRSVG